MRVGNNISVVTGGGVCAVLEDDSVRLFTLGSASRRIPDKEWEIPLPVTSPAKCALYPGADVIVFAYLQQLRSAHLS